MNVPVAPWWYFTSPMTSSSPTLPRYCAASNSVMHLFVRHVDDVRDDVEPAAMRHAEHGVGDAVLGEHVEHLLEHRHHDVEPFARERLLAEERLAHVAIEGFDARQPLEKLDLPLRARA